MVIRKIFKNNFPFKKFLLVARFFLHWSAYIKSIGGFRCLEIPGDRTKKGPIIIYLINLPILFIRSITMHIYN